MSSGRDLRQQRVDPREARLRALFDAVLHGRVPLFGGCEAHRLRQLRLVTQILELERLQVILEGLHEALWRLNLPKLALDDPVCSAEPPDAARTDVHLLDDRAVSPPLGDQLGVRPDGEDVGARRVEDPLDPDLELVRRGDGGFARRQLTALFTSLRIFASSAAVSSVRAYAIGHIEPSSSFALSLKPNIA